MRISELEAAIDILQTLEGTYDSVRTFLQQHLQKKYEERRIRDLMQQHGISRTLAKRALNIRDNK